MEGSLGDLLAYGVALLLVAGAATKLHDRADFALAVEAYEIVPERLAGRFALAFAILELAAGLLLLPAAGRPYGAVLTVGVVGTATLAVIVNLRRGRRMIDCGCGGVSGRQPISWWLVGRNIGLLALLLAAPALAPVGLDLAATLLGAVVFVLMYAATDQLLANGLRQAALRRPV